jgi:hypothetical protein
MCGECRSHSCRIAASSPFMARLSSSWSVCIPSGN